MEALEPVKELIGELLMIVLSVVVFIVLVGIKVECPKCGARFYYHHDVCPECGYVYGEPLDDEEESDGTEDDD